MDILHFITEDDCDDAHARVAESSWTTETQQMRQKVWTDGTASGHKPLPSKASAEWNRVTIQVKCLFTPMSLIFVAPLHDYNSSLQLMCTDEDEGFSWMPGQVSQHQHWTAFVYLVQWSTDGVHSFSTIWKFAFVADKGPRTSTWEQLTTQG